MGLGSAGDETFRVRTEAFFHIFSFLFWRVFVLNLVGRRKDSFDFLVFLTRLEANKGRATKIKFPFGGGETLREGFFILT